MKSLKESIYASIINEAVASDDVLESIQELLNNYLVGKYFNISINEIFDIDSSDNQTENAYGFDTSDELLTDVAGYLIEVFIWNKLNKELFNDSKFLDIWNKDVINAEQGSFAAQQKMTPLVRRKTKGKYWDFELPGVDGKFEIKARLIDDNGKSGGFRYTANQLNDSKLNYILVKYKIEKNSIKIDSIEVKKKI